jgi:imidazolonepropionase-like amidohydrolase
VIGLSPRSSVIQLASVLLLVGLWPQPPSAQAPSGVTALTGARVIDGTGAAPLERATIIISGGRVQAVGGAAEVTIPPGASRVDVSGKTIMPGIINSHGHVDAARGSTAPVRDQLLEQLRLYARYGVTTVYSLGSTAADAQEGVTLRDEQDHVALDRARLFTVGEVIADKTPADARKSVDRNADMKVDMIKIRVDGPDGSPNKMTPDIYRAVIDEAHKRSLRVAGHLYYLKDALGLLDAGVDVLAHSVRDADVNRTFLDQVKSRNVGYIPTLTRDLSVFVYETTPAFFTDPFFLRGKESYAKQVAQLSDPAAQAKVRASADAQTIKQALEQANRNLKKLSDAGVSIAMGTDSGANLIGRWQGYFEHTEMEMMVKAGMTPMQTIVAATSRAARVMNLDGQIGALQPGKWADFVVLNANPLTDMRNTRQIDTIWIGGRRLAETALSKAP